MNREDPGAAVATASVIVPAYNAAATIGACVAALQRQTVPAAVLEIIVVDDASTDDTAAIARAAGARVVSLPYNQGRSAARNAGAAAAGAPYLLFTDADCEPTPGWVAAMLAPFSADPTTVGVKGAYLCRQPEVVARFTQLELEEKYRVLARRETIAFIDTYAAAYRRDVFLAHGGFDVSLTYSMLEDQDLSFRLAAHGLRMVFAPEARVYHRHVTTATAYYRRKFTIGKWKTVILRRHPERALRDSRTPPALKVQFALALGLTVGLPVALLWPAGRRLWWAGLAALAASGVPFWLTSARRDPGVAWAVPPLLLLRALGLAHGYLAGLWQLRRER